MPIAWDDLEKGVDPAGFSVTTVPDLLARSRRDPWKDLLSEPQRITVAAIKALKG